MEGILTAPAAGDVRKAINEFRGWDDEPDPALNLLFAENPQNTNLDQVLLKVVALNALYSTMIRVNSKLTPTVYDIARHIVDLNIDATLDVGSESLVNEIANTNALAEKLNKSKQYNYSFATKYCSFHRPESYPIYDSRVNECLWHLRNLGELRQFKRMDLWEYTKFKKIVTEFRDSLLPARFTYKEIDQYLYVVGGKLLAAKEKEKQSIIASVKAVGAD